MGWSGGVDSTALLLALHQCGFVVQAWHIDHAWHDGSRTCRALLAEQAKAWRIPFFHQRLQPPETRNREALARQGRYQAFSTLCIQQHIQTLCLGHHAGDQAETVCMRLLQGASFKGCCGIHDERIMMNMRIVRPLLHLTKKQLSTAIQPLVEDPSNHDMSLWRNRIRQRLFPAIVAAGYSPQHLFLRWREQAIRLNNQVTALAANITIHKKNQQCYVVWELWRVSIQPVRVAILQCMMTHTCGVGRVLGRKHIILIDTWRQQGGRKGLDLSGCRLEHKKDKLFLTSRR